MKKKIGLLLLFSFIINFSYGQIVRCGTYELHKMKMDADPAYRAYYEKIEQRMQAWSNLKAEARTSDELITIPVVVHVIYNTTDQNISDAQILSQIDVLNHDYTATNSNISNVPSGFRSRIGNPNLNFCLATVAPNGDYSTGIERRYTTITSFGFGDPRIKSTADSGLDAWDRSKYLNLWVCNMGGGLLGYTEMPGCAPQVDGCVILYAAFGNTGDLYPNFSAYNLGRTATHEIGHWLGLYHVWGDDGGACSGTDYIDDTPNQADWTYGCPASPDIDGCAHYKDDDSIPGDPVNGIMFMNYLDYSDDRCMDMFSAGQVAVMHAILDTVRTSILTSNGCQAPQGLAGINAESFISLYPNPAYNVIHIDSHLPTATVLSVSAYNTIGEKVITSQVHKTGEQSINIDVSALSTGLYILIVSTDEGNIAKRFSVTR